MAKRVQKKTRSKVGRKSGRKTAPSKSTIKHGSRAGKRRPSPTITKTTKLDEMSGRQATTAIRLSIPRTQAGSSTLSGGSSLKPLGVKRTDFAKKAALQSAKRAGKRAAKKVRESIKKGRRGRRAKAKQR